MKKFLKYIWTLFAKSVAKLNRKYENMKEPSRFYTMLAVAFLPWFLLDLIGLISGNKGFDFLGLGWIAFLMVIRIWWYEGRLKYYLIEK